MITLISDPKLLTFLFQHLLQPIQAENELGLNYCSARLVASEEF